MAQGLASSKCLVSDSTLPSSACFTVAMATTREPNDSHGFLSLWLLPPSRPRLLRSARPHPGLRSTREPSRRLPPTVLCDSPASHTPDVTLVSFRPGDADPFLLTAERAPGFRLRVPPSRDPICPDRVRTASSGSGTRSPLPSATR